jgi:mRNA-degrading endonuclease toxin of MazEF toxin-antitoxin module
VNPDDLAVGQVLTNEMYSAEPRRAVVTSVTRTVHRSRVTRFRLRWEGTDADAGHMPGDARYLEVVT